MLGAQRAGPGGVERRRRLAQGVGQGRERQAGIGQQFDLAAPVVAQFVGMVGDADEARLLEHGGRAVGHLVVELAADHQHQVGLLHGPGAHRADHRRRARRRPDRGSPACPGRRAPLASSSRVSAAPAPRAPRPVTTSGRRAARSSVGGARHLAGIGRHARTRLRRQVLVQHAGVGTAWRSTSVGISRYTGPGGLPSPSAIAQALSRSRAIWSATRSVRDARVTGARMRHMVDALQRAQVVLRQRRAAADQQHRHALQVGVGHGRHAVGHARAGGGHGDAHAADKRGVRMRHVHRGAFVAHVDDAHAKLVPGGPRSAGCGRPAGRRCGRRRARRRKRATHSATLRWGAGVAGAIDSLRK